MWIAIVIFSAVFLLARRIHKVNGRLAHRPSQASDAHSLRRVYVNPLGQPAADIERAWNSGDWDWARAALQKLSYSMVGKGVSQAQKEGFKALMTRFAEKDPLYREIIKALLPIIKQQPGILQSAIYVHAPRYDVETIRYVLYFAHELGDLTRLKKGRSYQLLIPVQATTIAPMKKTAQEIRQEYSARRYVQLKDPDLLKSRPYWKYLTNKTMVTPCHQEWDGLVLHHNDPWWNNHFPPNDAKCRCHVAAVSADKYTGQRAPRD